MGRDPTAPRHVGRTAPWLLAVLAFALVTVGVVGSIGGHTRFDPTDLNVPPAAAALLAIVAMTFAGMGALLAARIPRNPLGWLLLAIGLSMAAALGGIGYVALGWRGDRWGMWAEQWISLCSFFLIVYVLLLFPDGRLTSSRWRPAAWLAHATAAVVLIESVVPYTSSKGHFTNPTALAAFAGTVLTGNRLGFVLIPFATVAAVASLVARFRRSVGAPRQQLKWFAFAGAVVAVGYLFQNVTWFTEQWFGSRWAGFGILVLMASFGTVPVATAVAVLRYRLYDVDRLISRSVTYLLVSGIVTALYVGVIAAGAAVSPGDSQVAVAAATLIAAAAFNPVRHRVQSLIDRRFNRPHYDAVRLVEHFASGLRTTVSTEGVVLQLGDAVHGAVEPTHVSLWRPRHATVES